MQLSAFRYIINARGKLRERKKRGAKVVRHRLQQCVVVIQQFFDKLKHFWNFKFNFDMQLCTICSNKQLFVQFLRLQRNQVKFRYSEKATKLEKIFHLNVKFQVEDFFKFCGLLRISELYDRWKIFFLKLTSNLNFITKVPPKLLDLPLVMHAVSFKENFTVQSIDNFQCLNFKLRIKTKVQLFALA